MIRADWLTPKNIVAFVLNALRDISDGLTVIQKHLQDLPGLHCFQPQFGLDKIIGANHASEVQHRVGITFLIHSSLTSFMGLKH